MKGPLSKPGSRGSLTCWTHKWHTCSRLSLSCDHDHKKTSCAVTSPTSCSLDYPLCLVLHKVLVDLTRLLISINEKLWNCEKSLPSCQASRGPGPMTLVGFRQWYFGEIPPLSPWNIHGRSARTWCVGHLPLWGKTALTKMGIFSWNCTVAHCYHHLIPHYYYNNNFKNVILSLDSGLK